MHQPQRVCWTALNASPTVIIENVNAGINESNDYRRPVTLWVRETQKMPWVYLSRSQ